MKDVMPKGTEPKGTENGTEKDTVKGTVNYTNKDTVPKENGCTEPLYGEKSKCVLHILPQSTKCETFQIDEKCIKRRHQ